MNELNNTVTAHCLLLWQTVCNNAASLKTQNSNITNAKYSRILP